MTTLACPKCQQPSVMGQCRGCRGPVATCACPRPIRQPAWLRADLRRDLTERRAA